jgi:hypothetical protein
MRALAVGLLALLAAGCGDSAGGSGSALVDTSRPPPLINSLERDPGSDALLLTTNRGLYRISDGEATRVPAAVDTPDGPSPVGKFLAVAESEEGILLGSGHPDERKRVAPFLGLLRSENGGEDWSVVSRYGIADLHVIRDLEGTLYAYDAVLPAVIVSTDGGKTWDERSAPPGRVFDLVVDPSDPEQFLASTKQALFRSTDGGRSWTASSGAAGATLAWPEPEALYRADEDGQVYVSRDHASTWELIGLIDGDPRALDAASADELYAAGSDATIYRSDDGGAEWEEYFTP